MMVHVMLPIWLISWAVLLPLNSVKTSIFGFSSLYRFSFGNIDTTHCLDQYITVLIITWVFMSKLQA